MHRGYEDVLSASYMGVRPSDHTSIEMSQQAGPPDNASARRQGSSNGGTRDHGPPEHQSLLLSDPVLSNSQHAARDHQDPQAGMDSTPSAASLTPMQPPNPKSEHIHRARSTPPPISSRRPRGARLPARSASSQLLEAWEDRDRPDDTGYQPLLKPPKQLAAVGPAQERRFLRHRARTAVLINFVSIMERMDEQVSSTLISDTCRQQ